MMLCVVCTWILSQDDVVCLDRLHVEPDVALRSTKQQTMELLDVLG